MLPLLHRECYEAFKQTLEQASTAVVQTNSDGSDLKRMVTELQQFFQERILSLNANELNPEIEQRVQSYQVEINKQLRLLGMDVLFLQAARQATTSEQRRSQVSDRLMILIRYCEAMLEGEE
ncbi:heterocyst frequency control protein PatD [Kovacikia minuta CCNUW1]|uniref:heterocyst frequency control protein PatD n=1 Tax=Kovacikia minuta TaxID=2931930 RepID=UPI001CCE7BB6|nr:heterocyst frequency control protein PatD [Kovacikia minuta]UBF26142.1 heterocyst frequency control protein PatD [Kovacikia minuta CCNUW1]